MRQQGKKQENVTESMLYSELSLSQTLVFYQGIIELQWLEH